MEMGTAIEESEEIKKKSRFSQIVFSMQLREQEALPLANKAPGLTEAESCAGHWLPGSPVVLRHGPGEAVLWFWL